MAPTLFCAENTLRDKIETLIEMTEQISKNFQFPATMALFIDFDGTLVNFKNNPDEVYLSKNQTLLIIQINETLEGALALISGRDLRDLSKRVPKGLWRLGNHGLYAVEPYKYFYDEIENFDADLRQKIGQVAASFKGVWVEEKGPILAIHHRRNPSIGKDILQSLIPFISNEDNLVLEYGNNVVEIKPKTANKGLALLLQMEAPAFKGRVPVMIGDDSTDEDAFLAAQSLGGYGIKIGVGMTAARYRIKNIAQLYRYLERLV